MIRRPLPRFLARSLGATGAVLLTATALMFTASTAPASAAEPVAGVDDFDFSSWDAVYEVGMDDDGRATLHVVETRVAEFPDSDQNRGIVAGYPDSYEGAGIGTTILSVRDESGDAVPYETEKDDGLLYVLTGTDDYVHGSTTYVIEYEMRDVILAAEGTKVDEFYWDLLPQDSTQGIGSFHAQITFDDRLATHLTGASSCYLGFYGSSDTCSLLREGSTFSVSADDLAAREGVTIAIALEQGTVTQPPARLPNAATDVAPYWIGGGAAALSVGAWVAIAATKRRRRRDTGIIVAQYDVPDSMPPLLASTIIPRAKNALAAQIIHLAVRGLVHLEEMSGGSEKKNGRPRLRRLKGRIPDPIDERSLNALFGGRGPGRVQRLPENDEKFANRMRGLLNGAPHEAAQRGLTTKARSIPAAVIQLIAVALLAVMAVLLAWAVFTGRESVGALLFAFLICGVFVGASCFASLRKHTVLTPEGALQLEYLNGVREFIRVAEADRLRMLQSYSGAERRSDGTVDVIHVYEKLLPYAILFGQEREWGEVLEVNYAGEQRSAGWIDGSPTGLAARLVVFSAVTRSSSTYSAPSSGSSSSFGGSSGGGFSGGGGGGGFSGGR